MTTVVFAQDVENLQTFQDGRSDRRVLRAAPMGLYQQKHPRTQQGHRFHRRQTHVPRGHHPSGVGHLRQGLRFRHQKLRAQGSAVDNTTGSEQTTKVRDTRFCRDKNQTAFNNRGFHTFQILLDAQNGPVRFRRHSNTRSQIKVIGLRFLFFN